MDLRHLAIIMDGNGRWAKARGLPRSDGHRAGAETARRITQAIRRRGIPFLTLYALSTENLARPADEVNALAGLMRRYLDEETKNLVAHGIRLRVIGDRALVSADLRRRIAAAEKTTATGNALTLTLAVAYGGRDEIVRAARAAGPKLTEARLAASLDTAGIPDPDLIVRTGGEVRLSNFLLWQAAYAELYFTKTLWPDFGPRALAAALAAFNRRTRRFGLTEAATKGKPP